MAGDRAVRAFAYHRAIAPMLWVLTSLAAVELLVVHLLLSFWSRTAAILVSLATLASMIWLIDAIRSLRRMPVLLDEDTLLMRLGSFRSIAIPRARIVGVRQQWDAAELKARDVVNLARIAWPNVLVEIAPPLPGRRPVRAVAHRLDDPQAFLAVLGLRESRHDWTQTSAEAGQPPAHL